MNTNKDTGITTSAINWNQPDEYGLSERTLGSLYLSVKEVMKQKGEVNPLCFLQPFTCTRSGLLLRRKEPVLDFGWELRRYIIPVDSIITQIQNIFAQEGYCLFYCKPREIPSTVFCRIQESIHWILIKDFDKTGVTLIDKNGGTPWFRGNTGVIPWDVFIAGMNDMEQNGAAHLTKQKEKGIRHMDLFTERLIQNSLVEMDEREGLKCFHTFIMEMESMADHRFVHELEKIFAGIYEYSKLYDLWLLAATRKFMPERFVKPDWVEEISFLCRCWMVVRNLWKTPRNERGHNVFREH